MTYKDIALNTKNQDTRIVSMVRLTDTKVLVATSYQIYVIENNEIKPLELTEVV